MFEEESFESDHQEGQQRGNADSVPKDHPSITHTSPVRGLHQHHKQQSHSQSSSNGNVNSNINGHLGSGNHTQPLRHATRPRKDTISSVNSAGARSVKSIHPFASAVLRPTSPPLPKTTSGLLAPSQSSGLPASRSQPNLADLYKASQSPTMPHQVNFVSEEDDRDDEDNCPVCCESLSFTFRLPGEKPHIVPECGHALHEVCSIHPQSSHSRDIVSSADQAGMLCHGIWRGATRGIQKELGCLRRMSATDEDHRWRRYRQTKQEQ